MVSVYGMVLDNRSYIYGEHVSSKNLYRHFVVDLIVVECIVSITTN